MKNVLIVTYCTWTSLGSMLQSLGLKKALAEIGYSSVILLEKNTNDYGSIQVKSIKRFLIRLHELFIKKKKVDAFNKRIGFIKKNLDVEYFDSYDELEASTLLENIDCVLAGSDQIWNPTNIKPLFFLEFAKSKRKISYAASMGNTILENEKREVFKTYLKGFDNISVREQECADVLHMLTEKKIEVNIDPVFLYDVNDWRTHEVLYPIKESYILLYMLFWDKSCKEKIKELKEKTGMKVIAIANQLSRVYADEVLYDVGPGEFLWLIDHAEYVISSSFHGVAFSVLFNKKFAAVINPKSPSRINNLMNCLSVPQVEIEKLDEVVSFDYEYINEAIRREKIKSIQYLKRVLKNE